MPRDSYPVNIDDKGDETHPGFGLITLHRVSSTGTPLFQSDLRHQEFMRISIRRAKRNRDGNHDWTHATEEIVSCDLSLAQWGSFVSSVANGSGTPVTLYSIDGEMVPEIPYQPRIAESLEETRSVVDKLLTEIKNAYRDLDEAEKRKVGIRERRELMTQLASKINNASSNAAFAVTILNEQADRAVQQAKADIETAIANAVRHHQVTGPVLAPDLIGHRQIAGPTDQSGEPSSHHDDQV